MATIAYSMAGEGRGHATRAKTVIDHLLRRQHHVLIFAPHFAYTFLNRVYHDEHRVSVKQIPGLMFHYRNGKLNYSQTTIGATQYLVRLPQLINMICLDLARHEVDLAITDFEPSLPRAAAKEWIPWISIDHQNFLVVSDFSEFPWKMRLRVNAMSQVVKRYYQQPARAIVSSFYFPKLKPAYSNVTQTGVLLREQVINARPIKENHILVYLRRFDDSRLLKALQDCRHEVRVYGLGQRRQEGNLRFEPVSEAGFLEDLRTCRAMISNAGNQLVGEALFLKKPVFVIPEARNFEQELNAHFLKKSGGGDWSFSDEMTPEILHRFLSNHASFHCNIPEQRLNGNTETFKVIDSLLPGAFSPIATPPKELISA